MFFHFVKSGDYLYELSKRYNVEVNKIIEDNSLINPTELVINQCLLIDNNKDYYIVKQDDTLSSIANKFNLSLNDLLEINKNLNPNKLMIGQKINLNKKVKKIINGYCYVFSNKENIEKTLPYLSTLSIFSYRVNDDGSLSNENDDELIKLAKRYHVKPIMVITNSKENGGFSPSLTKIILNNDKLIDTLIDNIEKVLNKKGYEGINIDFEYVNQNDKNQFIRFVKKVNSYFRNKGYYLSICLAPKTSSNQEGLLYTSHDYNQLGKEVDNVILMTYEWGYTFGPSMPVAPYNEIKRVLEYAIKEIDRNKILMGIPNYGYDFIVPYKEKQRAKSIKNNEAIEIAYDNKVSIERNKNGRTPYFKYSKNNIEHEVQFDDPCSIEEKLSLVDEFNINGVSIWTISTYIKYIYLLINHYYEIDKNL